MVSKKRQAVPESVVDACINRPCGPQYHSKKLPLEACSTAVKSPIEVCCTAVTFALRGIRNHVAVRVSKSPVFAPGSPKSQVADVPHQASRAEMPCQHVTKKQVREGYNLGTELR